MSINITELYHIAQHKTYKINECHSVYSRVTIEDVNYINTSVPFHSGWKSRLFEPILASLFAEYHIE